MPGLKPIELFSVVAGAFAIASFIVNIYQYFKVQSHRQVINSIDRIGKLTQLECSKLKTAAGSKEEREQAKVVSDLISSILNRTTTFMKSKHNRFEKTNKSS